MKALVLLAGIMVITGCAPVLKSTITEPPDMHPVIADRVVMKGFDYKETYLVGKSRSYSPNVGAWYKIANWGKILAHEIGVSLGMQITQTYNEKFDDIGTLRNQMKDYIENNDFAKSVVTFTDMQELKLSDSPDKIIVEGKSSNESVSGATPWYWGVYNVVDYITLMAFLGVPVHYEKEATVSLGVYNDRYEKLGKYTGFSRVSQNAYVYPDEVLTGDALRYAYLDALNKAAAEYDELQKKKSE